MPHPFPTHARTVIIGGGIVGCSLAYHLTQLGRPDVVLLEQGRLSCGTTWHAAGLVGQLRSHASLTRLIRASAELYAGLEAETGLATGWKQCGSISVARTEQRMVQLRRTAASARAQGVEVHLLSPAEAAGKFPLMRTDDLHGAAWLPGDGKANPADITQSLARGARNRGARIIEQTRVTAIEHDRAGVHAVHTTQGRIACEQLAICAGQWSRAVGRMCGVTIPLHSAEHMYIVTGRIDGVHPDLPVLRDPDGYIYVKEEVGGLLMGGFEPDAKPWGMDGIPEPFEFQLLPDDWDQFDILMQNALIRLPSLETAEIKTFLNGPESFTPDGNFILGEAPETRNVFVAAGFNSAGIASAGGAGRALAEWILAGESTQDLWPVDIRRFARFNGNQRWLRDRVKEVLGLHYAMPWPNRELASARPLRRSPLYDRLAAKGAVFGSRMGWERANWFAPAGTPRETTYSFNRQNWFATVGAEHRACRETVALFDMTSFAKLLLQGRDAERVLQHLCANDMAIPPGRTVDTPMLNHRAGFESNLTVARLADDAFLLLTGATQAVRDAHWIRGHIQDDARAVLTDVSAGYAVIGVMGPHARALLAQLSDADLGAGAFPFGAVREISIGHATCWAACRGSMGEHGWELYIPTDLALTVYDTLIAAGAEFGLRDGGYYAIELLRLEQAHRAWGRELTPDVTPWQAGLGFAVQPNKPTDFIGRDALLRSADAPLHRRLISFLATDPDTRPAWGGELVLAGTDATGEITSAAYGYTFGGVVALGWVHAKDAPLDATWLAERQFALDIGSEIVPVRASLTPFYDPAATRQRA